MKIAIIGGGISGLATAHLLCGEHEVTVSLKEIPLFKREGQIVWRDLDRSLKPPEKMTVKGPDVKEMGRGSSMDLGIEEETPDEEDIETQLSGEDPQDKTMERLKITVEGEQVRLLVRPRDYRILQAEIQ